MFCQIFKESLWWCTEANTETMSKYLWTYSNCICTIYKFHCTLLCMLNLIRPPFHVLLVLSLLHHLPLIIVIVFGVIIVGASCIWWPSFLLWSDVLFASCLQSPVFFLSFFLFLLLPGSSALNFQRWKLFFSHLKFLLCSWFQNWDHQIHILITPLLILVSQSQMWGNCTSSLLCFFFHCHV